LYSDRIIYSLYTETMHNIGKYLKQLREQENISIRELAKKIGISHNTMAAYERESIMPSIENAHIVAEYFGVPIEFLIKGRKVLSDFNDADLLACFREIDEMDREDRTIVKNFLNKFIRNKKEREELIQESTDV
jgi:transcriptional regulator with XRE-family HTH domain